MPAIVSHTFDLRVMGTSRTGDSQRAGPHAGGALDAALNFVAMSIARGRTRRSLKDGQCSFKSGREPVAHTVATDFFVRDGHARTVTARQRNACGS
jgi:hypothetical protein